MNILIVGSVPSVSYNDEELLVKSIAENLLNRGHTVDTFLLPFKSGILNAPDQFFAYQLVNVNDAELLITVGYPAHIIPHNNKIIYLFDTLPDLFDYFDSTLTPLGTDQKSAIKERLMKIEGYALKNAKAVFCSSNFLCNDFRIRYNIETHVLYPPCLPIKNVQYSNQLNEFSQTDYFVTESVLTPETRMMDILEEFKVLEKPLFVFVPSADETFYGAASRLIKKIGLTDKVILLNGNLPNDIIRDSLAYLHFDNNTRKMKGSLIRCLSIGIPVIYTKDCGGAYDLLKDYKQASESNINKFVSDCNRLNKRRANKLTPSPIAMENFIERLVD
ncbi:MAG: hypothetical protein LBE13_13180 [Bacteroidales bacterium]|jgi:hypothetical protein|nr:hypothetical protein [Bacteroidales bacterium]